MPSTTDNPAERAREGDDADWAHWEKTFRDARPVLPEAAMARIEASILREASKSAPPRRPRRVRLWILLLFGFLVMVNAAVLVFMMTGNSTRPPTLGPGRGVGMMHEEFPMDVTIGPALVAPDRPILPLAEYRDLFAYKPKDDPSFPAASVREDLLKAAEHVGENELDGWHQLGLLEMRRVAGKPAPLAVPFEPHANTFHIAAAWNMLGKENWANDAFRDQLRRIDIREQMIVDGDQSTGELYWANFYTNMLAGHDGRPVDDRVMNQPVQFPSRLANQARFELLTELGESKAQAALDVLTTRNYLPLQKLEAMYPQPAATAPDYTPIAHDVVERLAALHMLHRQTEMNDLLVKARLVRYLNDPQDLAVLLARLGPEAAWKQLLQPLMQDEIGFIDNPPSFTNTNTSVENASTAIVESSTKSVKDGITTYLGPVLNVSAGPWRISCDQLKPYRNADHGTLLSGSGKVRVEGVYGLFSATADEMTLNTRTGDLKLAGHVHLDGWTQSKDVPSCTISRTEEVKSQ